MVNILNIALKDFSELIGSRSFLVIILIYIILVGFSAISVYESSSITLNTLFTGISYTIISYGGLLGLIVGYISMSSEKFGGAINTLITKPLYRDTIINGKILSCTGFLLCVFGLSVALYTALLLALCGDAAGRLMSDYFSRLPILLFVVVLCALFYTLLSILVSIIVKRPTVALLVSAVLFIFLDQIAPTLSFAGNIGVVTGSARLGYLASLISPFGIWGTIMYDGGLGNAAVSIPDALTFGWPYFAWLLIYTLILLIACYTMFIRRDIS